MEFLIRGQKFSIEEKYISYSVFLSTLKSTPVNTERDGEAFVLDLDPHAFELYLLFLQGKDFEVTEEMNDLFDFMGHPNQMLYPLDYWKIKLQDNWIRDNMYKFRLYEDPYYGLVELPIKRRITYYEYYEKHIYRAHLRNGDPKNLELDKTLDGKLATILAGGAALWMAGEAPYSHDCDLFFVCSKEEAILILQSKKYIDYKVNTASIMGPSRLIQYIARTYKAPTEVVHGFDVDSCGVLWDGLKLWATKRAFYAILNKVNWFDPARTSPSYSYRLAKYRSRGYEIGLPLFDPSRIQYQSIKDVMILMCQDLVNSKISSPNILDRELPEGIYKAFFNELVDKYYNEIIELCSCEASKEFFLKNHLNHVYAESMLLSQRLKTLLRWFLEDSIMKHPTDDPLLTKLFYSGAGRCYLSGLEKSPATVLILSQFFRLSASIHSTSDYDKEMEYADEKDMDVSNASSLEWTEQDPMQQVSSTRYPTPVDNLEEWYCTSYLYK